MLVSGLGYSLSHARSSTLATLWTGIARAFTVHVRVGTFIDSQSLLVGEGLVETLGYLRGIRICIDDFADFVALFASPAVADNEEDDA